ncbi:ABC transporter permease [Acidaminobacter sp. JC074]|uniref:ABC transporter permease subunit n=1 Tax=Acidaminobacter sp. JC074 TaxID=2530199 RepID=UPI001F0D57E0|nr:ABC transporter permease [Acidaminobacter sp. JC074]MCH4888639.1 ABC transporter permease [Acidaminobacter sp. JC074]
MNLVKRLGLPRIIIIAFFIFLWVVAGVKALPIPILMKDSLVRIGMNLIMVLAMVPAIRSGIGLNFALPIGIICGILGGVMAIEFEIIGILGFLYSLAIAIPLSVAFGWIYGIMLNKIKGSEMLVSTYVGFSIVSLFCIAWIVLPFTSDEMRWPIGEGLRTVVSLESTFGGILNRFWAIEFSNGFVFPTGLILFGGFVCLVYYIFSQTRVGIAMKTVGDNPKFAAATGLNVDRYRILGTILSTVLGAIGMVVFAQSFGYIQLYTAPLMMAFPAVAAILIGGATAKKANISFVIIGTILFQGLLTISLPVASSFFEGGNISEVIRMIVQNGIILYALAQGGGE